MRKALPAPVTPHGLPYGLQRGGSLDAPWLPQGFIDRPLTRVPVASGQGTRVSQSVFYSPVAFSSPDRIRPITRSADVRPLPVGMRHPVTLPYGDQKGGIFGDGTVIETFNVHRVPQAYSGSPDGIGGW